jgi:thioesterase domain-containing protein
MIQPGESERPVFFFHGDFNGGGLYCVPLARNLGSEHGFVAVHPHGVGSPVIPATIEEMAVDRLRSIRELQREGPYRLGGHCNGALVALEIAHQLIREGERVEFLAVLAPPESIQWENPASGFAVQTEPIPPADLTGIPHSDRPPHLLKAYHQACGRYVMRRYPGAMLVVVPHSDLARYRSLERWKRTAAQVVIHIVPGAHLSMLAPRHSGALAKVLKQYLKAP